MKQKQVNRNLLNYKREEKGVIEGKIHRFNLVAKKKNNI